MDDTKNSNQNPVIPPDPHQDVPPPMPNIPSIPVMPDITHNNDLPTESIVEPSSQNPLLASSDTPQEPEALPIADVAHSTAQDSTISPGGENTNGVNKKLIGGIAAFVLLAVAIPAGIFLTNQNQDSRGQAQEISENTNIPAPLTERRLNVAGILVAKTEDSLTLEDKGVKTTIQFLPDYTKIYQLPSAVEYSPVHIPLNTYIYGTVFITPEDRSSSGEEVMVGEILHLPGNFK